MSNFQLHSLQISPKQSVLNDSISVSVDFSCENPTELASWWDVIFVIDIAYFRIEKPLTCTVKSTDNNSSCTLVISGFEVLRKEDSLQLENISVLQLKLQNRVGLVADVNMLVQLSYDESRTGYLKTILYGPEEDKDQQET